jgi:hypothetical protein
MEESFAISPGDVQGWEAEALSDFWKAESQEEGRRRTTMIHGQTY